MGSLTIYLPNDLAERVEKTGVLQSAEMIEFIEKMTIKAEQQQNALDVLHSAWGCVQPPHSVENIDQDIATMRNEWSNRI